MEDNSNQRRLAAILAADVAGYTKLVEQDTDGTVAAWKTARDSVIMPLVEDKSGRIIKFTGDGFLAEFPSVQDAVACAIEMQEELASSSLKFRMGINVGDITDDGGDVHGEGVNIAARLEGLAEPGGICISGDVYNQVRNRIDANYTDMGDQEVKHVSRPVRAYAIGLSGHATTEVPTVAIIDKPTIAVLPFTNMSGDPEQEYFSDGLTEDLIAAMGRFRSIAVIARNSAFHYKGKLPLAHQVGEELGVKYLVEGSVRTSGNRIRVSAQLTETQDSKQLWAEQYDRELEDVFSVQDDVVSSIAAELGINLTVAAEARTRSLPPDSLTAYDRLLKGRAAWWRGNYNEGFRLIEEAVAADPTYAAAKAWLALQHAHQVYSASMGIPPEELGPKSRNLAEQALELDDRDPFIHMSASMCFGFTPGGNKERGLRHIEKAASMNPHDSEITLFRAWSLAYFGRFDESLEYIQQVQALNPLSGYVVNECLADLYYMMGDYERCLATFEDYSETPPHVLTIFAACHAQLGAEDEAQHCLEYAAEQGVGNFDSKRMAEVTITSCVRQQDADLWRDGFQKAGLVL